MSGGDQIIANSEGGLESSGRDGIWERKMYEVVETYASLARITLDGILSGQSANDALGLGFLGVGRHLCFRIRSRCGESS